MADAPAAPVSENGALSHDKGEETPGHKIFAGNLAYSVSDDSLRQFFAVVESDIVAAQVITRNRRSMGYGFVTVSSAEAAEKACSALNQKDLEGRNVIVEVAKPADQKSKERIERRSNRRPGRRGAKPVPGEVTEAEANGVVDKAEEGPAGEDGDKPRRRKRNFRKPRQRTRQDGDSPAVNGNGDTAAEGEADKEDSANRRRPRVPRKPRTVRPKGEEPNGEVSKTVVFVANLAFSVEDAGLAKVFTDAGINVVSARVVKRRWGQPRRSKGYGFVDVGDESQQVKAIEALDGKELEGGRKIVVKVAVNANEEDDEKDEGPAGEATAN